MTPADLDELERLVRERGATELRRHEAEDLIALARAALDARETYAIELDFGARIQHGKSLEWCRGRVHGVSGLRIVRERDGEVVS